MTIPHWGLAIMVQAAQPSPQSRHPILYHEILKGQYMWTSLPTNFAWSRIFPIEGKGDAHYTLNELLHHYGVPMRLISDDAKELISGNFTKKAHQAQCPQDMTDPTVCGRIILSQKSESLNASALDGW